MSGVGSAAPGTARTCPHCRATILQSAIVCPACDHSLRFDSHAAPRTRPGFPALRVEGTLHAPRAEQAWEYSMVLSIRDARGEEISRQVVGVGALKPDEERTFTLAVELSRPGPAATGTKR